MFTILQYSFIQNAFLAGTCVAAEPPLLATL